MRIGSLFSGYGGLDLAIESVFPEAEVAWTSDIDPGACTVLAVRFPDAPNLGDITKIDWATVEPVDILAGGSPCQDVSMAGRRAGMREGTRSNLWVTMREAIAVLRPRLVVWENVGGAYSAGADSALERCAGCLGIDDFGRPLRALGRVLGDLSSIGYDASWTDLRASDVGAPHQRRRVFVVAAPSDSSDLGLERSRATRETDALRDGSSDGDRRTHLTLFPTPRASDGPKGGPNQRGSSGDATLPSAAVSLLPTPAARDYKDGADFTPRPSKHKLPDEIKLLPTPNTMDSIQPRSDERLAEARQRGGCSNLKDVRPVEWGKYRNAVRRWERIFGAPAPSPTSPSPKTGNPQLSSKFVEWMMSLPSGWVTGLGLSRNAELKLLGNGVVPAQAEEALRRLLGISVLDSLL